MNINNAERAVIGVNIDEAEVSWRTRIRGSRLARHAIAAAEEGISSMVVKNTWLGYGPTLERTSTYDFAAYLLAGQGVAIKVFKVDHQGTFDNDTHVLIMGPVGKEAGITGAGSVPPKSERVYPPAE